MASLSPAYRIVEDAAMSQMVLCTYRQRMQNAWPNILRFPSNSGWNVIVAEEVMESGFSRAGLLMESASIWMRT